MSDNGSWMKRFYERFLEDDELMAIGNTWILYLAAAVFVAVQEGFSFRGVAWFYAILMFTMTIVHVDAMHTAAGKGLEKRVERLEEELEEAQL